MKPWRLKLRAKFLIVFTLILFVPLILIVWIITNEVIQKFDRQAKEEAAQSLESVYRELEITKDAVRTKIDLTSDQKDVKEILIDINKGVNPIQQHYDLGARLKEDKGLDILDILLNEKVTINDTELQEGTIITSGHWQANFGYIDNEDLRIARGEPLVPVFRYEKFEFDEGLSIQAAKTIKLGDASIIISGGNWVDQEFINKLERIAHARVLLMDREKSKWLLSNSSSERIRIANQSSVSDDLTIETPDYLQRIYASNTYVEGRLRIGDISYYCSGTVLKSGDQPFGIIIVAKSEQPLRNLIMGIRKYFVIIALGGAVFAWVLAVIIVNRIVVSPIRDLVKGTKAISSGDLDYRIPVTSNDEIGELEQSFNRMTEDLQENKRLLIQVERMAAWQEIARRMAHEIKNPLFPIQLSIQTLQKSFRKDHPEFAEIFEESTTTILEEVESIKRILGEFTELAQMSKPILEEGHIDDVIDRALALYRGLPGSIPIEVDIQDNLPKLRFDKDQISQVLKNLISNAIEAMPEGGTLGVKTYRQPVESPDTDPMGIVIEISDTGKGIDENIKDKIFTPYFTTKNEGTGLGLAIVYRIVANHGGYITFKSKPGQGTVFRIVLPIDPDRVPQE